MKELQMLIDKWKQEAALIKDKNGIAVNFAAIPIAAEYRRLRKCITEAELLLHEIQLNNNPSPQLPQADVKRSAGPLNPQTLQ